MGCNNPSCNCGDCACGSDCNCGSASSSPRVGRTTWPEAALAIVALVGYFAVAWRSTPLDVRVFIVTLLIIGVFYATLLLVRAIFTFMTGSQHFWWEKYEERDVHGHKHHDHDHSHDHDHPHGH